MTRQGLTQDWSARRMLEIIAVALPLVLALLSFLPGLGAYKMLDPTDSFFVEAAREMMEKRHYITPLFNYSDWLDKPALPFLLIVACYKIFGISAWAARLPSALAAVLLVVYTYWSTIAFLGKRAALIAALILCASPLFSIVGHVALSDEPLTMFLGIALLSFARVLILADKWTIPIAYASLAVAILLKGPIALVLCFCIIGSYFAISGQGLQLALARIKRLNPLLGVLFLLAGCLPYYLLAHVTTNGAFTHDFFWRQNLGRFEGTVNHQEPIWWYLPIWLGGFFPWTVVLLSSGMWLKKVWAHRVNGTKRQSFLVFACLWLLIVLVLFSAIPTKLPTYIVPSSPALAIIVAAYLQSLLRRQTNQHSRVFYAVSCLLGVTYVSCALLVPIIFCQFYKIEQSGLANLIELAKQKHAHVATLFSPVPSLTFSIGKQVTCVNSLSELEAFCKQGPWPHFLLARNNCLKIPQLRAQKHIVANTDKWYLLQVDSYLSENTK